MQEYAANYQQCQVSRHPEASFHLKGKDMKKFVSEKVFTKFSGIELGWSELKNALLNEKCQDYFSVPLVGEGQEEVRITKSFQKFVTDSICVEPMFVWPK